MTKSNTSFVRRSTTSAGLNAAFEELRSQITPLQQIWTREAAAAYQVEQLRWHQAATALNEILVDLGNAVRDGADDVANADRRAADTWAGSRIAPKILCGPDGGEPPGPTQLHFVADGEDASEIEQGAVWAGRISLPQFGFQLGGELVGVAG